MNFTLYDYLILTFTTWISLFISTWNVFYRLNFTFYYHLNFILFTFLFDQHRVIIIKVQLICSFHEFLKFLNFACKRQEVVCINLKKSCKQRINNNTEVWYALLYNPQQAQGISFIFAYFPLAPSIDTFLNYYFFFPNKISLRLKHSCISKFDSRVLRYW